MNTRRQIVLAVSLVGLAVASVGAYGLLSAPAKAAGAMAGHNHASTAGGEGVGQPVGLTDEAARRIGVTYVTVERGPFVRTVRTVGNVTYDETRLANVDPKIEGWVERLYVDFTGQEVRRGQPLLEVYAPMLVSAQEELLLARRLVDEARGETALGNARELLESARRRLRYWDVPAAEVAEIERSGTPRRTLTLTAPASGVVVEKSVVRGARIMPGMDVYRIADLSRVWVEGEVFEKDLSLVRLGQHGLVTFDAYPGERFDAVVTYVYPSVSLESRTGRVRLELANPGLRLKPGMYAKVTFSTGGTRTALLIPADAVHYTGERALVFVKEASGELRPREITTGLPADDRVEVLSGLSAGEVVVASANFLVDAESNMGSAMGSMPGMDMSTPGAGDAPGAATPGLDTGGKTQPATVRSGAAAGATPGMEPSQKDRPGGNRSTMPGVDHSRMPGMQVPASGAAHAGHR